MLTLLLGKMLDVSWHGPHRGKLSLVCQGSYICSTWIKQNLHFDCHVIWNSNANHMSWLDSSCVIDVRYWRYVETNITRCPFRRRISFLYLSNLSYQQWFTSMNPRKQTNRQHRTNSLQISGPLESPATCSYMQQDKIWVARESWLSFIHLWLVP